MSESIIITWEKFLNDVNTLGESLKGKGFTKILAITKGGLIPAYFIAKILNISYVETACVHSYTGEEQGPLKFDKLVGSGEDGWLIIDDLVDSGKTLIAVRQFYPKSKTATLYVKECSPQPDYFVELFPNNWIVFPWEN